MEIFASQMVSRKRRDGNRESIVSFVQKFSNKTETTLKNTAFATYPAHEVLLNVSLSKDKE